MNFQEKKQKTLDNMYLNDKSRKKTIDIEIIPLLKLINSKNEYFTTSSCSGRIYILTQPKSKKKEDVKWLYMTHNKANFKEIKKSILPIPDETCWIRQEGLILHVCCKTINHANELLTLARNCGYKRSGIIAIRKNIIVEICSTEKLDVPITENKKTLITDKYLNYLVKKSNEKQKISDSRRIKFYQTLKKYLK